MADDTGAERAGVAGMAGIHRPSQRTKMGRPHYSPCADACAPPDVPGSERTGSSCMQDDVFEPGTQIGRYELIRLVGRGGMGAVYEAHDARLDRRVALKVLAGRLAGKPKAAKRFSIEARAAARLVHPNVVGIFDVDLECRPPYLAMEFLQGETLAAAIGKGELSVRQLADIMLAVCAGVHAAHTAGIIHRDLKPSNIFLCRDWQGIETARVLDFGVSKLGDVISTTLTPAGDILGTWQYLSPEQAAGKRQVDARSDQYSLGVVMYECLTRRTPHRGERMYSLLRNVAEGQHALAHVFRPGLAPAIEAIVERALQVQPAHRFPTLRELGRALFPFASAEIQRQFNDFYNRGKGRVKTPEVSVSSLGTGFPEGDLHLAPTQPMSVHAPEPWQERTTRTSSRSAGRGFRACSTLNPRNHARAVASGAMVTNSTAGSRRVLLGLALGVLLVVLAFAAMRLAQSYAKGHPSPGAEAESSPSRQSDQSPGGSRSRPEIW